MMKTQNSTYLFHNTHRVYQTNRKENRRYFAGTISQSDFCTNYPGINHALKVESSIRWSENLKLVGGFVNA